MSSLYVTFTALWCRTVVNLLNCDDLSVSLLRIASVKFRIIAAAVLGAVTALTAGSVTPALAATPRTFATEVSGACDTTTGEWVVDWAITNQSDTNALLILMESTPAASALASLPWPQGGATEHAIQRIPGDSTSASLVYIAVWTDFPGGSYRSATSFAPPAVCEQAPVAG
jgi:hypothetical protein